MAKVIFKEEENGIIKFRLSNKPEYLCFLDLCDFNKYIENSSCWYIHVGIKGRKIAYIRRSTWPAKRNEHLHRRILGVGAYDFKLPVDHIDGNGLNNTRENLREVSCSLNARNRFDGFSQNDKSFSHNGYWATYIEKRKCYQCYNRREYIGYSKTIKGIKEKIDNYIERMKI